jgi:4-hydroxy-tetrahydrodipicolinate reductase
VNVSINGALGRMGKTIIEVCLQDKEISIVGLADLKGPTKVYDNLPVVELTLEKYISSTDVVIDFSSPEGTQEVLRLCLQYKKPIVIGTTGHSEEQLNNIKNLLRKFQ